MLDRRRQEREVRNRSSCGEESWPTSEYAARIFFVRCGKDGAFEYAVLLENIGVGFKTQGKLKQAAYKVSACASDAPDKKETLEYTALLQNLGPCFGAQAHHAKAMRMYELSMVAFEAAGEMSRRQESFEGV